ncbi:pyridoxal phosphate-dependent decarboxylase family protein [Micromonospora sp. DT43]|uniref:pyridoxal phosphate-dependent decarboxylase family protein n=1 Tax=Micromonospora sp. DT43 TaxID=3393440 RepID=UPI003CE6F437
MNSLSRHHVLAESTLKEFDASLEELIRACVDFKFAAPHVVPPSRMDRALLRDAAEITTNGRELSDVVGRFAETVLPACLNFAAPTFLAHPDAGNSSAGILGDVANAFLQQNLSSFDYGPAATVLEVHLLHTLRELVGYPTPSSGDSALSTGGAVVFGGAGANFSSLLAAREHLKRQLAARGRIFDPRRTRVLANRPFTHFSLRRSLHMLGLGNRDLTAQQRQEAGLAEEALCDVASQHFRIDPADLERQIEAVRARGEDIMCIFAVAGDSRFMAFDDLTALATIAERHDIWLHVDACEGGQVLFSPNRRELMAGVERAHSLSIDPHKVLLVPYNISLFFLREPQWLTYFSGDPATVINQDEMSLGGYTPAINSKSFISLKLLFMLQHWGWQRLAEEIDRRHALARTAAEWIDAHPNLRLVNPDVTHNAVAFMYLPNPEDPGDVAALNQLNRALHTRLNTETTFFVHAFPARDDEARIRADKGVIHPLRMMFGNPLSDWPVVRECLETTVRIGAALSREPEWQAR